MAHRFRPLPSLLLLALAASSACTPNTGTQASSSVAAAPSPTLAPSATAASAGMPASTAPKAITPSAAAAGLEPVEATDLDWEEEPDDEGKLEMQVSDVDAWGGTDVGGDGDVDYDATADVAVKGEAHPVSFHEDDQPLMSDEPDVLTLTDTATGDVETVTADQEFNSFTVRQGADTLSLEVDPTGAVVVDGTPTASLDEAAAQIAASPVLKDASPQNIAFLYGVLQRHTVEASRGEPACGMGSSQNDRNYRLFDAAPVPAEQTNQALISLVAKVMALREAE